MNEFPITTETIPANICYPRSVQGLVNFFAESSKVHIEGDPVEYLVSNQSIPVASNAVVWVQTSSPPGANEYGTPKAIRMYVSGQWKEFAPLRQGDAILVEAGSQIVAPWGQLGYTYSFPADTGLVNYTPTLTPGSTPAGLAYKIYVGYWSSKTP